MLVLLALATMMVAVQGRSHSNGGCPAVIANNSSRSLH
jgi:hypothetical protein